MSENRKINEQIAKEIFGRTLECRYNDEVCRKCGKFHCSTIPDNYSGDISLAWSVIETINTMSNEIRTRFLICCPVEIIRWEEELAAIQICKAALKAVRGIK